MYRGTNLPRIGDYNQAIVLDLIRRAPKGLTRAEVARRSKLSTQTVSNIVARLLNEGLVVVSGTQGVAGPGRPGETLRLNAEHSLVIGAHIDPGLLTVVLMDLVGKIHASFAREAEPDPRPDRIVRQLAGLVDELRGVAAARHRPILGVGVATPGPVDLRTGDVSNPPLLTQWRGDTPLREAMETATGLPVVIDKDSSASAFAHLWFPQMLAEGSFVLVYLGAGCAFATVLSGELRRGPTGNAGDVGSLLVAHDGPADSHGLVGTLGQLSRARTIVQEAVDAGVLAADDANLDSHLDVYRMFRTLGLQADQGDAGAAAILDRAIRHVVKGARDVAHVLEIDKLILGGPLWSLWPARALEVARAYLDETRAPTQRRALELMSSPWGPEVGAVGGASLVLEQAFAPRPSRLFADRLD